MLATGMLIDLGRGCVQVVGGNVLEERSCWGRRGSHFGCAQREERRYGLRSPAEVDEVKSKVRRKMGTCGGRRLVIDWAPVVV